MKILKLINFLKNLIFPQFCLGCGAIGSVLCEKCRYYRIVLLDQQFCQVCKKPSISGLTCKPCSLNFALTKVIVATHYDQLISSLIKIFKYGYNKDPAKILCDLLIKQINHHKLLNQNTIITFVPLTKKKLKSRGFNQSEILSRKIGEAFNVEVRELITKSKETKPQAHLSRKERLNNQKNAFKLKSPILEANKEFLIIDDVISTGATLHECALCLRDSGVIKISALVLAQSL